MLTLEISVISIFQKMTLYKLLFSIWEKLHVSDSYYWKKLLIDILTYFCLRKFQILYFHVYFFFFQKKFDDWETEQYVTLVGIDNYYLQYEVKVQAFNDYGRGPNSSASLVYSAEGSKSDFLVWTNMQLRYI